jgi:hypothetical protein
LKTWIFILYFYRIFFNTCEEWVWQQSQDGAWYCSQVLWVAPDFLIHLKISHDHRENCAGAPWCKIGPYDECWFWPMDCCYVDWADGAWLRGYIRDCDCGGAGDFLERDSSCMLKGSWINCFEKNVVSSLFSAGQRQKWQHTVGFTFLHQLAIKEISPGYWHKPIW